MQNFKEFLSKFKLNTSFNISKSLYLALIFILAWGVNFAITGYEITFGKKPAFVVGKPSPLTVQAPRNVRIEFEEKTRQLKEQARKSVKTVYYVDERSEIYARNRLQEFATIVSKAQENSLKPGELITQLEKRGFVGFKLDEARFLLNTSKDDLEKIISASDSSLNMLFMLRIKPEELDIARSKISSILDTLELSPNQKSVASKLVFNLLIPNYLPDMKETEKRRSQAEASVKPVIIERQKGEIIVRQGEVVKEEDLQVLKALGMLGKYPDPAHLFSLLILIGGVIAFIFGYTYFFDKEVFERPRRLFLLLTGFTMFNFIARIFINTEYHFLVPAPLPVIISNLMVGPISSIGMSVAIILQTMIYSEATPPLILILLTGCIVALIITRSIRHHRQLLTSGIVLALTMGVGGLVIGTYFRYDQSGLLNISLQSLLNGFLSTVFALGLLPFLEFAFHTTTMIRLLELSNPNHPLLKELMNKAPGTYNHSVMTANLSEAAAQAVDANPLLARVGSYFHDIGKLSRPLFFVENQAGGENPHDKTSPSLSRLIITSHVKDGVELARKHSLPEEIIYIIAQHHGTSLVSYFYEKAKKSENDKHLIEDAFRYPGEKPKSKEAAIVMLADSIEAASRSLVRPTEQRIEHLVRTIIKDKFEDGQLDESNLTFQELEKISRAFIQVLKGFYHVRLEYPNDVTTAKRVANSKKKR